MKKTVCSIVTFFALIACARADQSSPRGSDPSEKATTGIAIIQGYYQYAIHKLPQQSSPTTDISRVCMESIYVTWIYRYFEAIQASPDLKLEKISGFQDADELATNAQRDYFAFGKTNRDKLKLIQVKIADVVDPTAIKLEDAQENNFDIGLKTCASADFVLEVQAGLAARGGVSK